MILNGFFKKSFFKIGMWHSRPPRDPPLHGKCHLKFPFWFLAPFPYQSNFFRSYHKFLHKSWSNIFRISTKHQLQNLNQASAFWRNLNLKLLTKPIFRILTKIELHNHMKHQQQNNDQTSASKSCLNINFKILTKLWNLVLKVWTKT